MPKHQGAPLPDGSNRASAQGLRTTQPEQSELSKLMRREMRRADRTRIPLSLAVFRIAPADGDGASDLARLWAVVVANSRETDVPFRIDPNAVVVLLLDTDAAGADAFLRKILSQARRPSPEAAAQEYPGALFDKLLAGQFDLAAASPGSPHAPGAARPRSLVIPSAKVKKSAER